MTMLNRARPTTAARKRGTRRGYGKRWYSTLVEDRWDLSGRYYCCWSSQSVRNPPTNYVHGGLIKRSPTTPYAAIDFLREIRNTADANAGRFRVFPSSD